MAGEVKPRPFVSIGITTYKRHNLLRQTLESVLAQTFSDFEVIVGNDFTEELLTAEMIGINDPRVRFINHPRNLREIGNMNALLGMATGRYFTWLFDDDLYEPDFLQTAHDCLVSTGFPPAFFCRYKIIFGDEEFRPEKIDRTTIKEMTGSEFLRWYSVTRTALLPTYGLFDTETLKSRVGGLEELSDNVVGLYSEYHFLFKCGLFEKILYVDAPFYVFRQHEGSWSESNTDLENYRSVGRQLISYTSEVLSNQNLIANYSEFLFKVSSMHLIELAFKSARYVRYISKKEQSKFGIMAAFKIIAKHWTETRQIWKLYLSLGGEKNFFIYGTKLKIIVFCNYLMLSHFFHFFNSKRKQ